MAREAIETTVLFIFESLIASEEFCFFKGMQQIFSNIVERIPTDTIDKISIENCKCHVFFSHPWLPYVLFDENSVQLQFYNLHLDVLMQFQEAFECLSSFRAKNNPSIIAGFIVGLAECFQIEDASIESLDRMLLSRKIHGNIQSLFKRTTDREDNHLATLDRLNGVLNENFVNLPNLPYIVQTIYGVLQPRPPIWLHRQAGRYLPEYMDLKGTKNFLELTASPSTASTITLQPIWRYGVDAAIIFSDIMVIPQALGMTLEMRPGPYFPHPIAVEKDVDDLVYNPIILNHVYEALKQTKKGLTEYDTKTYGTHHTALIGFCGAPWTVMSYMVGREKSVDFLKQNPELSHKMLRKLCDVAVDYLCKQVEAGADLVQVFDSFVGELPDDLYIEFEKPYLCEIAEKFSKRCPTSPIQLFPRDLKPSLILDLAKNSKYWTFSVSQNFQEDSIKQFPLSTCIQGNLDPDHMYLDEQMIREKTCKMVSMFKNSLQSIRARYTVNLGHGTKPDMDPVKVGYFIDEVRSLFLGTRKSPLALAQAMSIQSCFLKSPFTIKTFECVTKGDKVLDRSLSEIGDKGLFTREIESKILEGKIDFAQHSLKDLETKLQPGLSIGAYSKRCNEFDCMIFSSVQSWKNMNDLPNGAIIGTSSLRRSAFVTHNWPHLVVKTIRGTVGTRLRKLLVDKQYDALILAQSGLERLFEYDKDLANSLPGFQKVELRTFYAAGQGCIALELSSANYSLSKCLKTYVELPEDAIKVQSERKVLEAIEGGCQVPFGVRLDKYDMKCNQYSEAKLLQRFSPSFRVPENFQFSSYVYDSESMTFEQFENLNFHDMLLELKKTKAIEKVKTARNKNC
eukprot:NODE_23_length_42016_cov_0.755803.p3 type:complete len:850 gc:universal NODE_23_length_42016_cov_0.755803:29988-32537(+)